MLSLSFFLLLGRLSGHLVDTTFHFFFKKACFLKIDALPQCWRAAHSDMIRPMAVS